jgi:hypothetical protein
VCVRRIRLFSVVIVSIIKLIVDTIVAGQITISRWFGWPLTEGADAGTSSSKSQRPVVAAGEVMSQGVV